MSTGKDYGLPAEYADWVEWYPTGTILPNPYATEAVRIATTKSMKIDGRWCDEATVIRHFVPPPPKPTLPDVKLGGVVRYRDADDQLCLAVRIGEDQWVNFTRQDETPAKLFAATPWTDDDLLGDADDDGFTVELPGL